MKAYEIMRDIIGEDFVKSTPWTVDRLKMGDENKEVGKIALCHIATPEVIREAARWGAELMITHECTFYNHTDEMGEDIITRKKKQLIEEAGFALYRYHDAMHSWGEDEVSSAFIEKVGLEGAFDTQMGFEADKPMSAAELAALTEKALGIKHIRIVGDAHTPSAHILLALGMRGSEVFKDFVNSAEKNIAVAGELCEWSDCEPVRDAAQMGIHKAVIILGHADSESFAMERLTKLIDKKYDGAEARYFDCGEIYTYVQ